MVVKARNVHVREGSTRQTLMGARGELRTLYQGNIFPSPLPVKNYAFYGFRSRM